MKYQYYFCNPFRNEIEEFCQLNNVPYKSRYDLITFSIWSTTDNAQALVEKASRITRRKPLVFVSYTKSELAKADLIWITPKHQRIDIINTDKAYSRCVGEDLLLRRVTLHMKQVQEFSIAKEPSAKSKSAFWTKDSGFSEIFTTCAVKKLVEDNYLKGIEFVNVTLQNSKRSNRIFQMTSNNAISMENFLLEHGEKIIPCPVCNKKRIIVEDLRTYQLCVRFDKLQPQSDMYVTEPVFSYGPTGISIPLYIISQNFYKLLDDNGLASSLTCSPVINAL